MPDGTELSTGPTGHLCIPTATLWAIEPPTVEAVGDRGVMMPRGRPYPEPDTAYRNAAECKKPTPF